jgi:hypothetical protein
VALIYIKMKFFKNKKKALERLTNPNRTGPGQRLDDNAGSSSSSQATPSDAKDAAKLALERRLAAEQEKQAEIEQRRRERQMKIEEERILERQMAELDVNERQEYEKKMQNVRKSSDDEVKKNLNPVLYTSHLVNQGLIAAPAQNMFALLVDSISASTNLEEDAQRELAARLFNTANSSQAKENALIRIRKMIQMIVENPTEPKYREIKRSHKLYADSVLPAFGAELFLLLCGFEIIENHPQKGQIIQLKEGIEIDLLPFYMEMLETTKIPLELHVYRHAKVYFIAKDAKIQPIEVPEWTYHLSGEEVAAIQKQREKEVEWWMTVCSKRPRITPTPFNVTIIRIRFCNGAVIEAMFAVHEFIKDIIIFVAHLLDIPPNSFSLKEAVGSRFDINTTESIGEIRLVPSAVLHFSYDQKDNNLPLPTPEHVKLCQSQREIMTFVGVDIADYKF